MVDTENQADIADKHLVTDNIRVFIAGKHLFADDIRLFIGGKQVVFGVEKLGFTSIKLIV